MMLYCERTKKQRAHETADSSRKLPPLFHQKYVINVFLQTTLLCGVPRLSSKKLTGINYYRRFAAMYLLNRLNRSNLTAVVTKKKLSVSPYRRHTITAFS